MEPPHKRRRIPRNVDPDAEIYERRARNDLRLKSTFESIFEKYGKDFSGIADEIDLQTGEIVVNRGHVLGMRDETDPGREEDLYDELKSDDELEKLDPQGKAHLLGLGPENSLNVSIASASKVSSSSTLISNVGTQHSKIEADVNVGKVIRGGHRDHTSKTGPRPTEEGVSTLSWKRRLRSRPSALTGSHKRSVDPSSNDGKAVEPAWRAPPLPKHAASVQEAASAPLFNPHQREHERSASPPGASLWAPKTSKSYSERLTDRPKNNSSTRRPKSSTVVQQPPVGMDLPVANVSSLDYEWSRISVRSRPEQMIKGSVLSTLPASVMLEPSGTAAWTLGEDQLLRFLKSTRVPYSKMVVYYPGRTEVDLEDRWFELHGLNSRLLNLRDDEPRTLDQVTTSSQNKDLQTRHDRSIPISEFHVPEKDYSSADLRGTQERVLLKDTQNDICETRHFGSGQQLRKQQSQPRQLFNDPSQSTFTLKIASRNPASELSGQVDCDRDMLSVDSCIEANQKGSDRAKLTRSYVNTPTNKDSTIVSEKDSSKHHSNPTRPQRSSKLQEEWNGLEKTTKATGEMSMDNQWELAILQHRSEDTSKFADATCQNCFSQATRKWYGQDKSLTCSACYQYSRKYKKCRRPALELKKFRTRRNSISHEAEASGISPSVNAPKSQIISNETSNLQIEDQEPPKTAKPITVPTRPSPPDDLSDDELSMPVKTVGTTATRPIKLPAPSSHAPRRHTIHL